MEFPVSGDILDSYQESRPSSWPQIEYYDLKLALACLNSHERSLITKAFGVETKKQSEGQLCRDYKLSPPELKRKLEQILSDLKVLMETPDKRVIAQRRLMREIVGE